MSQAWDSGYYHLPFAARLAGIVPARAFEFHASNQARFDGFPLLGELLQGLVWRITGRAEGANLVAFASVPLFAWFAKRRLGVPMHLTVLVLLAIPIVQTHVTSSYVDLPANAALAVVLLLAIEAYATGRAPEPAALAIALVAAAIAANMKALLHPLVACALVVLAVQTVRKLRARARRPLLAMLIALPIVFATPLKNAVAHGNPYYPVRLTVLGQTLPGPEDPYSATPPWLEDAPRPVRFACSLLEVGIRPMTSPRRWTVDQWMPSDSTGNRMGGFFGAYVALGLFVLGWRARRERRGPARRVAAAFAVLTLVTSLMPQSHELRYYMAWMIVLVTLNAWLACREGAQPFPIGARRQGMLAAVALAVVVIVTRGEYVRPSGSTFAELMRRKVDTHALSTVKDGQRICVKREPWNLLYAAPFHGGRDYVVKEAERTADCGDTPLL